MEFHGAILSSKLGNPKFHGIPCNYWRHRNGETIMFEIIPLNYMPFTVSCDLWHQLSVIAIAWLPQQWPLMSSSYSRNISGMVQACHWKDCINAWGIVKSVHDYDIIYHFLRRTVLRSIYAHTSRVCKARNVTDQNVFYMYFILFGMPEIYIIYWLQSNYRIRFFESCISRHAM